MSDQSISSDKLMTAFQSLPEDIKQAILDADVDRKISDIGTRNKLHIDKMGALAVETNLVMFGLARAEGFAGRLEKSLSAAPELAKKIAGEVSAEIFQNIRETLKKIEASTAGKPAPAVATNNNAPKPLGISPSVKYPEQKISSPSSSGDVAEMISAKEKKMAKILALKQEAGQQVEMETMAADGMVRKISATKNEFDKDRSIKLKVILDDFERQEMLVEEKLSEAENEVTDETNLLRGYNESLQSAVAEGDGEKANQWREKIENAEIKMKDAKAKIAISQDQKNTLGAKIMTAAKARIELEDTIKSRENADAEIALLQKELAELREKAKNPSVKTAGAVVPAPHQPSSATPKPVLPASSVQPEMPVPQKPKPAVATAPPHNRANAPTSLPMVPAEDLPAIIASAPMPKIVPVVSAKAPHAPAIPTVRANAEMPVPQKPKIVGQNPASTPIPTAPREADMPVPRKPRIVMPTTKSILDAQRGAMLEKEMPVPQKPKPASENKNAEDEISSEKLLTAFKNLPERVQDAVLDTDADKKIADIAGENNLNADKSGMLLVETNLVMFGLVAPEDFTSRLIKKAGLSNEQAQKIGAAVDAGIFQKIRDALRPDSEEEEDENLSANSGEEIVKSAGISLTGIGKNEQGVLQSSGIEMLSQGEETVPLQKRAENIPRVGVGKEEFQAELLHEIEDPTPAIAPSREAIALVKEKLSDTFTIPKKESMYTAGDLRSPAPLGARGADPYRENI